MFAKQACKGTILLVGLLLSAAFTPGPATANGDIDVDLRGGLYTDAEAGAVGGGLLMNVGENSGWYFNPNVEVVFGDDDTDAALSADFHYDFPTSSSISPYLGAGPSIWLDDNDNDLAVNLLGGIAGKRGEVRPFGQLKAIIGGNDEVAIMGGIRF
jgi:hypothetical protein